VTENHTKWMSALRAHSRIMCGLPLNPFVADNKKYSLIVVCLLWLTSLTPAYCARVANANM